MKKLNSKHITNYIVSAFLLSFSALINASEVTIAAIDIDGLHQKDGKGEYDTIITNTLNQSGVKADIKVYSPTRVTQLFESGKVDCMSPANKNPEFYSFNFETIETKPMFQAKVFIYNKAGDKPYTSLDQLKGKKVGVRGNMIYGKAIDDSGLDFKKARDIESNLERLNNGEIDAIIAFWPDSDTAFENAGITPLAHAEAIAVHDDSVLCRDSYASNEFVKAMNAGI